MKKLTLELLEKHQEETLNSLDKELETAWKEVNKAMDKVDLINNTKAKFQTQLLIAQTKWKTDEKN